jgi:hypothetical protein
MAVVRIEIAKSKTEGTVELTCYTDSSSILYLYDRGNMYFKLTVPFVEWKGYVKKHYPKIPLENKLV